MDEIQKYEELLNKARALAKERHKGQKRWNGDDYYLTHLVRVSREAGKKYLHQFPTESEQILSYKLSIVGILHDIVEDTTTKIEEIESLFGSEIAHAVSCITHPPDEPYQDYIKRVCKSPLAIDVKIEDLKHNMETVTGNKGKLYAMALEYLILRKSYNVLLGSYK